VVDAALIGVSHERWGETPKALFVLREGAELDEATIVAFCRERLAGFKCPTSIERRDDLPRTAPARSGSSSSATPTPRTRRGGGAALGI
jgi:acyl-CoA synthetase (AMP-forming)/AMP-acid ligase II